MNTMRLNLILLAVNPDQIAEPQKRPYKKCNERHFKVRQEVKKALRDSKYVEPAQCGTNV
jgi:hypothetical protein